MMGFFGGSKPEEKRDVKNSTLQIVSSGVLPSTDIIDKITDNKQIPHDIRKEYWYKDPVHASLTSLSNEGIRKQRHEMDVIDQIEDQYEQRVKVYVPGENISAEITKMRVNQIYAQSLENSNNEEATCLRDKITAASTINEVKQGETRKEVPKPATGLKKLLGIGV